MRKTGKLISEDNAVNMLFIAARFLFFIRYNLLGFSSYRAVILPLNVIFQM